MPHFVIECSENILEMSNAQEIMEVVYTKAEATGLFAKNDIKARIYPTTHYKLAETKDNFLHVFGYIMEGRTQEQKAALSRSIVRSLNERLPGLSILSMSITDFELATYCNKAMIDPANKTGDRHYGL